MHTAYALPFRPGLGPFYFSIEEWAPLFPPDVMGWLTQHAEEGPALADGTRLFVLPQGAALPVIVAVRMSLSFPLLLSAMPLYAPDQGHRDKADKPLIKRVWFSDGGLASNLPLHFFDELLPQHPTFAVNLKGEHPAHPNDHKAPCGDPGRVYLAQARHGRARFWEDPPEGSLTHFVGSIFKTMHSWRDEALFPYAGYRDRIVQISIRPGEGGLNLSMSPTKIADLAKAGACAGDQLAKRFDPAAPDSGWTRHREVRARTALGNLALLARNAQAQAGKGHWRAAIAQTYPPAEAALAQTLLADLEAMGAKVEVSSDVDLAGAMRRPYSVLKPVPQH
jgi:predicted acylesterase/phospholipase RssA